MIFDGVELPSLLPLDKAACILCVEPSIVEQWIDEGLLETVCTNGQVRVLTSSIEDRMGQPTSSRSHREAQT